MNALQHPTPRQHHPSCFIFIFCKIPLGLYEANVTAEHSCNGWLAQPFKSVWNITDLWSCLLSSSVVFPLQMSTPMILYCDVYPRCPWGKQWRSTGCSEAHWRVTDSGGVLSIFKTDGLSLAWLCPTTQCRGDLSKIMCTKDVDIILFTDHFCEEKSNGTHLSNLHPLSHHQCCVWPNMDLHLYALISRKLRREDECSNKWLGYDWLAHCSTSTVHLSTAPCWLSKRKKEQPCQSSLILPLN